MILWSRDQFPSLWIWVNTGLNTTYAIFSSFPTNVNYHVSVFHSYVLRSYPLFYLSTSSSTVHFLITIVFYLVLIAGTASIYTWFFFKSILTILIDLLIHINFKICYQSQGKFLLAFYRFHYVWYTIILS